MKYDQCITTVSKTLEKRGFDNHKELSAGMCSMWADENGVEREFGRSTSTEPVRRSFALNISEDTDMTFTSDEGIDTVTFPVIAITSGLHTYEDDDVEQKVYIEPTILKDNIEAFKELPIYVNHQRTPEDLIGMATEPEVFEMENGKTALKMLATVSNKYGHGQEVMDKVKDGDMTHVSIDWFSNDIDVMGDTYATNIRPTEVSFIDNEKMDPVCKECTIDKECELHPEDDHDCGCGGDKGCECKQDGTTEVETMAEEENKKSDAENIVEREFASLRTQLEEMQASKKEIETQYEDALKQIEAFRVAEEERAAKEAEERKAQTIESIISKQVVLGQVEEDKKDARLEELSAWDENKLTGFSEALASMPEPAEVERTFGKGKANEGEALPETERQFGVKMNEKGRIVLDKEVLLQN